MRHGEAPWSIAPNRYSFDPEAFEMLSHELRMSHADAEAEAPHCGYVVYVALKLMEHEACPCIVGGVNVAKSRNVVALAASPGDGPQVDSIMDAVVREWCQPVLLDSVPQSQFCSDAIAEPVEDRQSI